MCDKKNLKCFCKLCITEAVRCNREFATATDKSMEDIIKEWFRYAKDLDGGRKERTSKKNKEEEQNRDNRSDNSESEHEQLQD